jgi:hypothetical protein
MKKHAKYRYFAHPERGLCLWRLRKATEAWSTAKPFWKRAIEAPSRLKRFGIRPISKRAAKSRFPSASII